MSDAEQPVATSANSAGAGRRLCMLLACFAGAKRASKVRADVDKGLRSGGGTVLDEVVLRVNGKGKAQVYDPRRTMAGTLTSALTWGLFGLAASGGSWKSLLIWAVIGALCGGMYAYFTEHVLTKSELKRIGKSMVPDTSALAIWAETADARSLLSATTALQPTTASVAVIADDLSAQVLAGAGNPLKSSSTGAGSGPASGSTVLAMLLLRYPGEGTARQAAAKAVKAGGSAPQVELVFESDKSGKRRVVSPAMGVAAMAKSDIVSWGLFGVAWGAIVGFAGDGGILSSIENGVVTGVLWAIFGLVAGALYGLWAGRAVSVRRLKQVGPILPPNSSLILAWADRAVTDQTIRALSAREMDRLDVRFNPIGSGALLEV